MLIKHLLWVKMEHWNLSTSVSFQVGLIIENLLQFYNYVEFLISFGRPLLLSNTVHFILHSSCTCVIFFFWVSSSLLRYFFSTIANSGGELMGLGMTIEWQCTANILCYTCRGQLYAEIKNGGMSIMFHIFTHESTHCNFPMNVTQGYSNTF